MSCDGVLHFPYDAVLHSGSYALDVVASWEAEDLQAECVETVAGGGAPAPDGGAGASGRGRAHMGAAVGAARRRFVYAVRRFDAPSAGAAGGEGAARLLFIQAAHDVRSGRYSCTGAVHAELAAVLLRHDHGGAVQGPLREAVERLLPPKVAAGAALLAVVQSQYAVRRGAARTAGGWRPRRVASARACPRAQERAGATPASLRAAYLDIVGALPLYGAAVYEALHHAAAGAPRPVRFAVSPRGLFIRSADGALEARSFREPRAFATMLNSCMLRLGAGGTVTPVTVIAFSASDVRARAHVCVCVCVCVRVCVCVWVCGGRVVM